MEIEGKDELKARKRYPAGYNENIFLPPMEVLYNLVITILMLGSVNPTSW
jgi:hypothetical protein